MTTTLLSPDVDNAVPHCYPDALINHECKTLNLQIFSHDPWEALKTLILCIQVQLVESIMQALIAGADSQVERGTEAVVLISSILQSARLLETERLHILGHCICTVLSAVWKGPAPTPTTLSNLLACLQLQSYAACLLAAPGSGSGLTREAGSEASDGADPHVAELLSLAMSLFSRAGGHAAGSGIISVLLSSEALEGKCILQICVVS